MTAPTPDAALWERLSARERDISFGVAAGLTDREIGVRLGLARSTIKLHLRAACKKCAVRRRTQLVAALYGFHLP